MVELVNGLTQLEGGDVAAFPSIELAMQRLERASQFDGYAVAASSRKARLTRFGSSSMSDLCSLAPAFQPRRGPSLRR